MAMAQFIDYFLCTREQIERWADALKDLDEDRQAEIEEEMATKITLRNIGDTEFELLAAAIPSSNGDLSTQTARSELVRAINEEMGPWIVALSVPHVEAIAGATLDEAILQKWIEAAAEFFDDEEESTRERLNLESAETFRQLSQSALAQGLEIYSCFYG
ncbi:hypothetical protein LOC68_10120 [Blastopirellula sp. JC732]|uniref:Uncharacterized protein n=1 Tax=Blastopirellula sediminis TaxID=2894196 RepID=A0A9X1MM45_9BACT|nr:hypothetical protein [Blastopirellula sediminis]MCC9608468.1 hypothetical protein [Blastopirellula sediminis]MCC9628755.1 hypothetical protein [Blastopirellula sediminis]